MYVRWKIKKLTGKRKSNGERSLYAVLVASERRNGQPRQKVIKHLAFINEGHLTNAEHQLRFWRQVDLALSTVPMSSEVRANVESKLKEVVPVREREEAPRDAEGRFLVVPEMAPVFESRIDWKGEFYQLADGSIEIHDSTQHCYVLSSSTLSLMDRVTQSMIRTKISLRLVQESHATLKRIASTSLRRNPPPNGR